MRIAATPLPPRNSALVERVLAELAGENEEAAERKGERERLRPVKSMFRFTNVGWPGVATTITSGYSLPWPACTVSA